MNLKKKLHLNTANDMKWWDVLRMNCRYLNGHRECINRPRKYGLGYIRCESQGCPLLRNDSTERNKKEK